MLYIQNASFINKYSVGRKTKGFLLISLKIVFTQPVTSLFYITLSLGHVHAFYMLQTILLNRPISSPSVS